MRTKTPRMILMGAAQYLKQHGWKRGDMGAHGGPRCMFGALFSAAEVPTRPGSSSKHVWQSDDTPLGQAAKQLRKMIARKSYTRFVYVYNDTIASGLDDVVAMLERAADREWDHSLEAVQDRAHSADAARYPDYE